MKTFCFKLLLLITVLVLSSGDVFAQVNWTKYSGNPIMTGPSGSWNRNLFMPCILYNADSSRYEMWFAGAVSGSRPYQIGFAVSDDGISWTMYPTPVLIPTFGNWDSYTVERPFVIRENGQYTMWYLGGALLPEKIGYATSPDGINWTKLADPVLEAGTEPWEAGGVMSCCIMPSTGEYKMWYSGYTTAVANGNICIGYATSPDGIAWQRNTINNPVLEPGNPGGWDDTHLFFPMVLTEDNLYYMWYTGSDAPFGLSQVGLATSSDGIIDWEKYEGNPVLSPTPGQWDGERLESGTMVLVGDTLYLWYSATNGSMWQIGLAKSLYKPLTLPPGTYTVGTGGNFATIQDAFNKLSTDGIAGPVTLELTDNLYTAPTDSFGFKLVGPIPGAGPSSRITIKPAANKNVTLEGNGRFVINFWDISYLNFDGVSKSGSTTFTVHSIYNTQFDVNRCVGLFNNSDHSTIQNLVLIGEDIYRYGDLLMVAARQNSLFAPDSNLIQNNFIKKGGGSIYLTGLFAGGNVRPTGNIIRGNLIGSETDSLINWGIQVEKCQNTLIENNVVQNLKIQNTVGEQVIIGINSYVGIGDIIRNNIVHNIKASVGYTSVGILLSGGTDGYGSNNSIYNNMVYDIQSTSTAFDSRVSGVQIWYQNNPKIYYNSVYLSGTGSNKYGSAALYIDEQCTNVDVKNNILVNTRDESPYCASSIYDNTTINLTSDYNDLFYETNQYNCLVRIFNAKFNTLANWQTLGKDLNSITEMPHFAAPDLHINSNILTNIESHATPIAGITSDFDGNLRNTATPDIGADEFNGTVVPVELTSFAASVIGTEVLLNWSTATELNNYGFEVQRKAIGGDFATVAFVKGQGTTTKKNEYSFADKNLEEGKYSYRLKQVDFSGTFEYSKTIEVEVSPVLVYSLEQNYPNPFNPTTTIGYVLQEKNSAKLTLLNSLGEEIAVLVNGEQDKGYHKVEFDGSKLSSGVYIYKLQAGTFLQMRKMILLK